VLSFRNKESKRGVAMLKRLLVVILSVSLVAVLVAAASASPPTKPDPVPKPVQSEPPVKLDSAVVVVLLGLPGRERPTIELAEADPPEETRKQRVDHLSRLRQVAHRWLARDLPAEKLATNRAYADLTFAFALARLGEAKASRELLKSAIDVLAPQQDAVHQCLLRAFTYRIEQALEKRPHTGPLPAEIFEPLARKEGAARLPQYMVDRMREQSRVLEPLESVDAFLPWVARGNDVMAGLAALEGMRAKTELEKRIRQLLQASEKLPEERLVVLARALSLSTRVSEAFTGELLGRVLPTLDAAKEAKAPTEWQAQAVLLERAVLLAADQGRQDLMKELAGHSFARLKVGLTENRLEQTGGLAGQTLRGLRKLGMRQEAERLLATLVADMPDREGLTRLRDQYGDRWPAALGALLGLASGQLYLGQKEGADPILSEAKALLLPLRDRSERPLGPVARARLASAYAAALGQGPAEMAVAQFEELLEKMDKLTDTFTTATHYSKLHLMMLEAMVLAINPAGP